MTKTLIEQLQELPIYGADLGNGKSDSVVSYDDLLAIIEQQKGEQRRIGGLTVEELDILNEELCEENDKQRILITELVQALEDHREYICDVVGVARNIVIAAGNPKAFEYDHIGYINRLDALLNKVKEIMIGDIK